jgi:hypothetical protein
MRCNKDSQDPLAAAASLSADLAVFVHRGVPLALLPAGGARPRTVHGRVDHGGQGGNVQIDRPRIRIEHRLLWLMVFLDEVARVELPLETDDHAGRLGMTRRPALDSGTPCWRR